MTDHGKSNIRPFNRGNKLLATGMEPYQFNPSKPMMWATSQIDEQLKFSRREQKRVITHKLHRHRIGKTILDPDSPYYGVHLDEAWAVIEDPSEIPSTPSYVDPLKSDNLLRVADMLMDMIHKEKCKNQKLVKLLDILLGDERPLDSVHLKSNSSENLTADSSMDSQIRESTEELEILTSDQLSNSTEYLNQLICIRSKVLDTIHKNKLLRKKLLNKEDTDDDSSSTEKSLQSQENEEKEDNVSIV